MQNEDSNVHQEDEEEQAQVRDDQARVVVRILKVKADWLLLRNVDHVLNVLFCINQVEIGYFTKLFIERVDIAWAFYFKERHMNHDLQPFNH